MSRRLRDAIAIATLAFAARASAHTIGLSRGTFTERPDGTIHAECSFALRDLDRAFDKDGHLAVEVRTDEAACEPGVPSVKPDDDGMAVEQDFACERATRSIEVIEYYGTEDVATIATDEGLHQELLSQAHRSISVTLRRAPRGRPPSKWRTAGIAIACAGFGLALIALVIRSILRRKA